MFCKHKIASHVPLFFQKPNWSFARFSSIIFSVRPKMIFVKILDVCVKIIQVQYSSHFVNLLFFGNITIILFLKLSGVFPVVYMFLSGIFPVVYMLLIRQYKVRFVSSSTACNNAAAMLSTPKDFLISIYLMPLQIQTLLLVDSVLRG